MPNFSQFLNEDQGSGLDIHSSAYGAAARGASTGGLSLDARRKLINQPRVISPYKNSHLGNNRNRLDTTRPILNLGGDDKVDDGQGTGSNRQAGGIKDQAQVDSSIAKRQHFTEPPKRNFDKFG